MAKFVDFGSGKDVQDIMERFIQRFPGMFQGFDVGRIGFLMTKKKKSSEPVKLRAVGYPCDAFMGKTYIVEAFEKVWLNMDQKKRNLAVFHIMCAIPDGGFDEQSKHYGKKLKPEIKMFLREFAAAGGVPNWMDNPAAADPLERTLEDIRKDSPVVDSEVERVPVTKESIEEV